MSFERDDPIRAKFKDADRLETARTHYEKFPYRSIVYYGAADLVESWYRRMGEILDVKPKERGRETSLGVDEVPEVRQDSAEGK